MTTNRGILFVVSAPSGGGKGSILGRVLGNDQSIKYSVSTTTRHPRPNEAEGDSYHFASVDEFERGIEDGAFVEWAKVHENYYGTPKSELEEQLNTGCDVVLELDVQGMRQIKESGANMVSIFIEPPSIPVLEQRLRGRGDLTEEELRIRLTNAKAEIAAKGEFDHVIVNNELGDAVERFKEIIRAARENR